MNDHVSPPYVVDLHIHTTFSDGKHTPEDVLCRAAEEGIQTLAFCDHDNTRGFRQGLSMAGELGMELVPGIELTCSWPGCGLPLASGDVDLLGYFFRSDDADFEAFTAASLDDVYDRVDACCCGLTALGFPVRREDLLAMNPHYAGLVQLLQVILQKRYAASWDAASELVENAWRQVRPAQLSIQAAIAHIHAAGGAAVLAHPVVLTGHGAWLQERDIANLAEAGLDGIEVYHRSASAKAQEHFLSLAQRFHLLVSGGSDEHGWFTDLSGLGGQPATFEMVDALRARRQPIAGTSLGKL